MANRVIHSEILCENPEQTILFFKEVFGWQFQQHAGQPYWLAITENNDTGGINGTVMEKREYREAAVKTTSVADIDAYAWKIERA